MTDPVTIFAQVLAVGMVACVAIMVTRNWLKDRKKRKEESNANRRDKDG